MGLTSTLLVVTLALVITNSGVECAGCPPPNKVPGYKQTCYSDYDCKNGQICCPNQSHTKSCTYPAPYSNRPKRRESYPWRMIIKADIVLEGTGQLENVNAGEHCGSVRCRPWEMCLPDPRDVQNLTCQLPLLFRTSSKLQ